MKKCNGWMNRAAFADVYSVTDINLSEEESNSDAKLDTFENEVAT